MKTNNGNIKTGYKVVREDMTSYWTSISLGGIEYSLNKKVYPKSGCGPLCVFDNLDDAEYFVYYSGCSYKIFKCNYEESKEIMIWNNYCETPSSSLILGAKLANWIELTEEIKL